MYFRITHITRYRYASPASESFMEARLTPCTDERQEVLSHALETSPAANLHAYTDYFGNRVQTFSLIRRHDDLQLTSVAEVRTTPGAAPPAPLEVTVSEARQIFRGDKLRLLEFLLPSPAVTFSPAIHQLANRFFRPGSALGSCLLALNGWMHETFTYQPGRTRIDTPLDEVLQTRTGVCQDFAQIMLAVLRSAEIPARYVTGYIETEQPTRAQGANGTAPPAADRGKPLPRLVGASESHAWVEACLPGGFWLSLDPTNNCFAGERHVKLAAGRDYHDCTPTRGVFKGTQTPTLKVSVVLQRVEPAGAGAP